MLAALIKFAATAAAHAQKLARLFAAAFAFRILVPTMTIAAAAAMLAETTRYAMMAPANAQPLAWQFAAMHASILSSTVNCGGCGQVCETTIGGYVDPSVGLFTIR